MNKLLIHSNNTAFSETDIFQLSEQFVFSIPFDVDDIDFYISHELESGTLREKLSKTDICFIKVALSENYLEYIGIRVAYHIRLTSSLKEKTRIPLVLLADESTSFLGKTSSIPSILYTEGIYVIKEDRSVLNKILSNINEHQLKSLQDFTKFINSIILPPPANYQSHHSIANEWSILRWSKVLGIPDTHQALVKVKENIDSLLFYKYLLNKFPVVPISNKKAFNIQSKGKILLVDDEWSKGWSIIIGEFLNSSPELTKGFETCEFSFKDLTTERIVQNCMDAVKSHDPDIVILDLRLSDADFSSSIPLTQYAGYQVLKAIKHLNPGIRVVIFTASNKAWNILELQNIGADGFIFKEYPDHAQDSDSSVSIKKLYETIKEQLQYSFLKDLFEICREIESHLNTQYNNAIDDYSSFIKRLRSQLNVIKSAMPLIKMEKPVTIDIAFLACYNFLELFKDYYLRETKDYRYELGIEQVDLNRYLINNRKIDTEEFVRNNHNDSPSWFHIQAGLSVDYFKSLTASYADLIQIKEIANWRNEYIHSDKTSFTTNELRIIIGFMLKQSRSLKE